MVVGDIIKAKSTLSNQRNPYDPIDDPTNRRILHEARSESPVSLYGSQRLQETWTYE